MTRDVSLNFQSKKSAGNLYLGARVFPHTRTWVGQASGPVKLSLPQGDLLGIAISYEFEHKQCRELGDFTSLDLSMCAYSSEILLGTLTASKLKELRLDFQNLSLGDFENIARVETLETLWLTGTSVRDEHLGKLQNLALSNLAIKNTAISDQGFAYLSKFPSLSRLHAPTTIGDSGVSKLSSSNSLTELDVSFSQISDEAAKTLATMAKLEALYLNDTNIQDTAIANLKGSKVKVLFLNGTKITDQCLEALGSLDKLEHLELRDTRITEIGAARLRSKLKECAIFGP